MKKQLTPAEISKRRKLNEITIVVVLATLSIGYLGCSSNNSSTDSTPPAIKDTTSWHVEDSLIGAINQDSIDNAIMIKADKKWNKTKAGRIHKKHPDWSVDDCRKVSKNEYWIGMSLDMLTYERGKPNSANPSDYGNGTQWQWGWDDYTPSYFYGGDDGIITAYN
jgi:hypothetical protein